MSDLPLVSLIVITYNSRHLLADFFATLARTDYPRYELIAVDNASTDGSAEALGGRAGVRVIANTANLGFGRACNQGARLARGELLVFLNPDLAFTPGWLAILVGAMEAFADAGIICPETPYPQGAAGEHAGAERAPAGNQGPLDTGASEPGTTYRPVEVAAVPGAAMMVRRAAWQALGGFDERIFLYWEDTDLCWRAWLAGWRVLRIPEAVVFHQRGGSGGGRGWDAEAARSGLYVHLKLMRWRRALPFAARLAAATLAKAALGRPGMWGAWFWNGRHLGETLAQRRAAHSSQHIDPARLEALADTHQRAMRDHIWYTRGTKRR
jgi:N-acetylglucosaminyl-diphospho-decaprenol L-rhamnosyltransferase